ncbi:MFS transporter [Paraburkholderia antibiotica]|uniref:MFS transporter n=1 Tax=Paraburkholderia antibiotica TaxID=2728839 RepID=A0A7X9ZZ46_9BURK|nr:MFS transporter [Paraburkholderia antibiotica]NML31988.1 MFS transporter [Paraburkholderia antibiotica]
MRRSGHRSEENNDDHASSSHPTYHPTPRTPGLAIATVVFAGIATSMLLGPLLDGWRGAWRASAVLVLVAAVALFFTTPADTPTPRVPGQSVGTALRAVVASRATTLLALCFAAYNVQFFSVMTFLPVFLMQRLGVALSTAGVIGAAIVAANAIGNLAAGALLARGMRAGPLLATAAIAMGCTGAGLFHPAPPAPLAVALGFLFSAFAGMLPATVLASAPSTAPTPSLAPLCIGWVMQGNYLGQVIGPLLIGAIVGGAGGAGAMGLLLVAAAIGAAFGLALPQPRVVAA